MTTAYSYIRFSTPEQSKGDSQRRQLERSREYAAAHSLPLDDTLTFKDLGRSAYRGKHAQDGGLSLFLTAIDEGRVEPGSFLLIENLDRLSRQPPVDALNLLQSIVEKGVTVVTLVDQRRYTKESLRNDASTLLVSIIVMFRAHEESKLKGERVRAAWQRKKQNDAREGKPITAMTPAWLRVVDGRFEVIEENAAAVRRVFDLATNEGLGQRAITTRLKQEGVPAIGRKGVWSETSVRRILTNPAVIGQYQPKSHDADNPLNRTDEGELIENYYPVVVSPAQYYDAQRLRDKALIPRGPRGDGVGTIFTGITYCGNCGASMRRKGASKYDKMNRLRCSVTCGAQSWKYEPLEKAVLMLLSSDLMPHVEVKESDRKVLQGKLAEALAKRDKMRSSIANLINAIAEGGDSKALATALKQAEQSETEAAEQVRKLEGDLRALETAKETAESRNASIAAMAKVLKEDETGLIREKLRYALSRSVDRIVLEDTEEFRSVRLEVGDAVRYIDFSKENKNFCLRGEEEATTTSVKMKLASGELKSIIP
jgi:DNA invertase Pin-like site-specific DNA recombinase